MSQLRSIIYKSKAHIKPFSPIEAELMDGILLENHRLGVTGFLVRSGDTYFQYIEGNEGVIYDVLERIRRSSLHSDFTYRSSSGSGPAVQTDGGSETGSCSTGFAW